jgi:hypothetical protein
MRATINRRGYPPDRMEVTGEVGHPSAADQDKVLRGSRASASRSISLEFQPRRATLRRRLAAPVSAGDVWTWTAICADRKLLVSGFSQIVDLAVEFVTDSKSRLANRVRRAGIHQGQARHLAPRTEAASKTKARHHNHRLRAFAFGIGSPPKSRRV